MRPVYLLGSIILLSFTLMVNEAASGGLPEAGASAPAFELPDITGKKVALSEFKGKVVLLNFWATWCSSCRAEMPSLNRLYGAFKNRGFIVLAVTLDRREEPVLSFIAENSVLFPVLMDKDKEVSFDQYAVLALPASFLIDRNGLVAERFPGVREWDSPAVKGKISKLLKKGEKND